jgi:hypothetical protein
MGGRRAATAAALIMAACAAGPLPGTSSGGTAADSGKGAKGAAGGAGDGGDGDEALTQSLIQALLAAGALDGCLGLASTTGSELPAKAAAASTLAALLKSQPGAAASVKAGFLAAGGLRVLGDLLGSSRLPLSARAAAAGRLPGTAGVCSSCDCLERTGQQATHPEAHEYAKEQSVHTRWQCVAQCERLASSAKRVMGNATAS